MSQSVRRLWITAQVIVAIAWSVDLLCNRWGELDGTGLIVGLGLGIGVISTIAVLTLVIMENYANRRMIACVIAQALAFVCVGMLPTTVSPMVYLSQTGLLLTAGLSLSPRLWLVPGISVACVAMRFIMQGNLVSATTVGMVTLLVSGMCYIIRQDRADLQHERTLSERARRSATELVETNVQLQNHAIQSMETALTNERVRVARDVHDIVGHALTATVVLLQNGIRLIPDQAERAQEEITTAIEVIRESLNEVRTSISALRNYTPEKPRGREDWLIIGGMFAQCTGIEVRMLVDEEFVEIDDDINDAVHRIIQEGLTNAYRHGYATLVRVDVWWRAGQLRVKLSDNGLGADQLTEGNGICGMRERVAHFGGALAWESMPGRGFDLGVEIPWRGGGKRV